VRAGVLLVELDLGDRRAALMSAAPRPEFGADLEFRAVWHHRGADRRRVRAGVLLVELDLGDRRAALMSAAPWA
jgi:hypothetical protein